MKKMKILFCLCLVVSLLGSSAGQLAAASSLAIKDSWAAEYVERAASLGLVPPEFTDLTLPITRAEFADLAVRLYENMTGSEIVGRISFNDTDDLNVQKMGYLGVVSGVGDGYFEPYGHITREQAAVILVRLFNAVHTYLGTDLPAMLDLPYLPGVFEDFEQISPWAFNGVASAYALGIMRGVGDNNFSPYGDFTIQQSIAAMLRVLGDAPSITVSITMNISSYTARGLSFHFENSTDNEFIYGEEFALYTFVNNAWERVEPIFDGYWAFASVAHIISPNAQTDERTIDWAWLFGELLGGHYRFQKEILIVHQPGDLDRFVLESDFVLP